MIYLFADSPNGFINHDSFGNVQDIRPGGLNWNRASRGMMHEVTPVADAAPVRGLQIFLLSPIGYIPPAEAEANDYRQLASQATKVEV